MHKKGNNYICKFFLISFIVCCLFSCSQTKTDEYFSEKLDVIDVYIANAQIKSAKKEIAKLEKSALSPDQKLSIAKRYLSINELNLAEKYLHSTIKKIPNNTGINALYGYLLLRQGKIAEAFPIIESLKDTEYASLYSEILFTKGFSSEQYYSVDYIDVYKDAYDATENFLWLKNAVSLVAHNFSVAEALAYKPLMIEEPQLLFWGLLEYDSENYYNTIDLLLSSISQKSPEAQIALVSDAYLQMGEIEKASQFWDKSFKMQYNIPLEVYINSSLFYDSVLQYENEKAILSEAIQKFPTEKPILALYADFAVASDKRKNADVSLLNTNLQTLKAEEAFNTPYIPVSEAMYRIENALQNHFSLELYVEKVLLEWQINNTRTDERFLQLYEILEKYRENDNYNDYLVNFAFSYFASYFREDEAINLFNKYFEKKYETKEYSKVLNNMDLWECEIAAFICAYEQNVQDAIMLYEKLCFESIVKPNDISLINLAMLYTTVGKNEQALKIYSQVVNKDIDKILASDIHFRIAKIKLLQHDKKNALQSLNYSIYLNPNNNRARFLLKQID